MRHLEEGTLQAFLDHELTAQERAGVVRHLAGCDTCAGELEVLRSAAETLTSALGGTDRAPAVEAAYAAVRAAAPHPRFAAPRIGFQRRTAPSPVVGVRRALVRAAMLVLGLAAAASAAIPGSPVREWLSEAWQRVAGGVERPAPAPAPDTPAPQAGEPAPLAGISILPHGGRVRILLQAPSPEARVRVRLTDSEQAGVYTTGAASSARFQTAPGRILVTEAGPGEIRVELPRSARASVVIDGRQVAAVTEGTLRATAPTLEAPDSDLVFRAGS